MTLLPGDPPATSAVLVQAVGNTQTLDQPYQTIRASLDGRTESGQTSAAALRWLGVDLWSAQVPAAERLNLYFEAGGSNMTATSAAEFQAFLSRFKGRSEVDFMVIGHTDRVGAATANEALSLRRAQSIAATLAQLGFAPDRTQAFGMGERRPLVPTDDEVPDPMNRRVELVAR